MSPKPDWFNYETTIACIREFIAAQHIEERKHSYLIMENAPWHKKAKWLINGNPEYADVKESVTIVSLPPYSPRLNPAGQV